jgi:uncharacterized membrane protein
MNLPRVTYLLLLTGVVLWCCGIVVAPVLASSGGPSSLVGNSFYIAFHNVCHQIEGRSFHIAGVQFGVCQRCTAIYFSFMLALLLYPAVRDIHNPRMPHRMPLMLAAGIMLLEVAGSWLGFIPLTIAGRLFTGALLGFVLAFYITPACLLCVKELSGKPGKTLVTHP